MIGLIIGNVIDISPTILFLILVASFIVAIISLCVNVSLLNFILILAIILTGILRYEQVTRLFPPHHINHFVEWNEPVTIIGNVVGFPHQRKNRIEVELQVKEIMIKEQRISVCGKILARFWRANFVPDYGDQFKLSGIIQKPRGERNPGEFNYQKYLAANGIYGIVNISNAQDALIQPATNKSSLGYFIFVVKRKFFRSLNELHHGQEQALIKGLLLGERGEISAELQEAFSKCGVIHILAISGLNIGYIGIIFFVLFSLFRFSYQLKIVAVMVSVVFYNMLVGFEPPIVRATLMMIIFLSGRLLQRPTDILNIISTAAFIIILINPQELFQASFQLSFGAILSMVYLYRRIKNICDKWNFFYKLTQNKFGNYLGTLFLVTLAAQLGTLPIVVYYFDRISVIGLLLNLLVIPLSGIIMALGLATMFCSLFSMSLAQLYANTNSICLDFFIQVVEKSGEFRFASVESGKIGWIIIVIFYFLLWIILNLDKKIYRKVLIFSTLVGAMIAIWEPVFLSQKWLQVLFFDVGQGDAALVNFPDGKNLLIDAGPQSDDFDAGKFFIVPYLKRERINRLNTVVLSHADNDHIGGMPAIFQNIQVDQILDSRLYQASSICSTYNRIIDSLQIQHKNPYAGQKLKDFENYGVYILHPGTAFIRKYRDDINNCSIVLKLVYGKIAFLFPGDIEKEAEEVLMNYGEVLRADVLKVAHHGSNTSSTMKWLKLVQPRYAVISVGKQNKFNFPATATLQRLNQLGIKIIRTDVNGAVIFRTDGTKLEWIK